MDAPIPIYDLRGDADRDRFDALLARWRADASGRGDAARTVAGVIDEVRRDGDDAVVRCMRRWVDPNFDADQIRVSPREMAAAAKGVDAALMKTIREAIANVLAYQTHIKPKDPEPITVDRAELGLRFTAVRSAGLTVPGGAAALFSTLIMLAVPAQVAGVDPRRIAVIHPPPTNREPDAATQPPIVAATCHELGIETLYRVGGAQAVAALAFGTQSIERVDLIAGPGNVYVQIAKAQLNGVVGTDGGFYGPSEILSIADGSADPAAVAADLIAQAEHDPGRCVLVAWSTDVIDRIVSEMRAQLPQRSRRDAIESAMADESCAVLVADRSAAAAVADHVACEHVNLAVVDPDRLMSQIRDAGEIFLGDRTPVAAGDYYAGPSHCLPTGGTARYTSGVSVYTFLKRTGTVCYREGMECGQVEAIARLAEAEGLDGHAASVRIRRRE